MTNERARIGVLAAALPLLAAAAALPGCGAGRAGDESGPGEIPVNVRVMNVEPGTLREYLTISGPLRPLRGTDVSTEERGVVDSLPKEKGAWVEEGDVIVALDRDLLEAQMRSAEADRDLREYNESRTRRLFEESQISRLEMLQVETELAQARAQADVARLRWERAAVRAPFAGIVADRFVEEGQLVAEGTPVARVVDPRVLKLVASVSEREVRWITPGAAAAVAVEGVADTREGRVHWVSFEADPGTGKFQVEVRVDNADGSLRPGVVARARVVREVHAEAIVVPRDAILLRANGPTVFVLEGDRARARDVELGGDQGLMTVVTKGLDGGERLVVRGQRELRDSSLVRVQEEATAPDGSTPGDPVEVRAAETLTPLDAATSGEDPAP